MWKHQCIRMKILVVLASVLAGCLGYPSGAPPSTCSSLKPLGPHGQPQDNSTHPYKLIVGDPSVPAAGTVTLQIVKIDQGSPDFKGFIVNARNKAGQVVGTFETG